MTDLIPLFYMIIQFDSSSLDSVAQQQAGVEKSEMVAHLKPNVLVIIHFLLLPLIMMLLLIMLILNSDSI